MILKQIPISQFYPVLNYQNLQNAVKLISLPLENRENSMKKQFKKLKIH